ncbi:MAG: hypothetical protein EOP24_43935, partial [Hyphomicrobiales bacterium]
KLSAEWSAPPPPVTPPTTPPTVSVTPPTTPPTVSVSPPSKPPALAGPALRPATIASVARAANALFLMTILRSSAARRLMNMHV